MDPCTALTPEDDIAIARRALAEGDLPHAAHHVGCALGVEPNRRDWLDLLDAILGTAPDPLALAPLGGPQPSYTVVALHAYALARLHRVGEALDLILQVIAVRPDVLYVEWALAWLLRPEAAGKLNMARAAWFLSALVQQYPALRSPDGGGRPTLERMPAFIDAVRRTQPPHAGFLSISVSMLRRLRHLDEALALAREAYALEPSVYSAIAVAVAHESRGEVEQALAAYRDALRFDPDDVPVRLSMADLLWNHNRAGEAEELYAEALRRDPEQPWALPSYYYLRFLREGDETWKDKLQALADAQPDNRRAGQLARQTRPYVGHLPDPSDATTNMMRAQAEKKAPIASMAVTSLEAPSNHLAFPALQGVHVSVTHMQQPDPRLPRGPVDYLLWKYDGTRPSVAVPPPDPAIAEAVAGVAAETYDLDAWLAAAGELGRRLGPGRVGDLLATMVHPPGVAESQRPWAWVFRVQVAAALVIARLEDGWEGSVRKKALYSLARGPMDWTVDAALVALTAVARGDVKVADDVAALFRELLEHLPTGGRVCYHHALLCCALCLPNLSDDERAELRRRLREQER